MIPTHTGAADAVEDVLPELKGRLSASALRVPMVNGSIIYFTCRTVREVSVEDVHRIMREAADGKLKGVMAVSDQPLVSSDYNHNPYSAVYDAPVTDVNGGRLCTVAAWYDNEWAFSVRMLDVAREMAELGMPG